MKMEIPERADAKPEVKPEPKAEDKPMRKGRKAKADDMPEGADGE